jgi:hypothetical protein
MTLCLAWKTNGHVHLASDSRISFGDDRYVDIAIKVFSIPVNIYSAIDAQTRRQTLAYNHILGMCFSGSTTNAYLVKESINEVLQHLQYTPDIELSMLNIGQLIAQFHEHTSRIICEQIGNRGIAEFILSGYCLATNRIRVFKYLINTSSFPIRVVLSEILAQDGIEYMGSGVRQARHIFEQSPNMSKFSLIKQIINDSTIPSVGGNIQYGKFNDNDFQIYGVLDYENEPNGQLRTRFNLRGTELYKEDFRAPFHIDYPFISPFQREIDDALSRRH